MSIATDLINALEKLGDAEIKRVEIWESRAVNAPSTPEWERAIMIAAVDVSVHSRRVAKLAAKWRKR